MPLRATLGLFLLLLATPPTAGAAPYALIDTTGSVVNVIEWDGAHAYSAPSGETMVAVPGGAAVSPGYRYSSGSGFSAPIVALSAAQKAQLDYQSALGAGITVACAPAATVCTAAIAGTYALGGTVKADVDGIYAGIKGGDGLPGGGASFNYPDAAGAMHAFTAPQFGEFAKAARDQFYLLGQAQAAEAAGQTPSWPSPVVQLQ